jgi:hypothetical protein
MRLYFLLLIFVVSCTNLNNSNKLEDAFFESEYYSQSDVLELEKWFELDSIFVLEKSAFEKNISEYENETKAYNRSLIKEYDTLKSTFYKNYLNIKIENLELFVQDIDFESAANKIDEVFNGLYDEFYELNSKMSPDDRKEIANKIGEFSATYLNMGIDSISEELSKNIEDFSKDFEDLSTQIESTLKKLFK